MDHKRRYIVHAGKHGRIEVSVWSTIVELRGEREAVARAAWNKLLGRDALGEDVDKTLPTRKFLMTEIFSRYENHRKDVFEIFSEKIKITLVGIGERHA